MSWIGLRDRSTCDFRVGGLGRPIQNTKAPDSLLTCGSLLLEFVAVPGNQDQVLLNHRSVFPEPSRLQLRLDLEGVLTLRQHRAGHETVHTVATGMVTRSSSVTVRFTWDTLASKCALSMEVEESGETHFATSNAPFAMSLRDAVRLIADPKSSDVGAGVKFVAIADHVMPHGPLPTLLPNTKIKTSIGQKTAGDLAVGDLVMGADGQTAQVRWAGSVALPARARFSPLRICAPFHNARGDIVCSFDQKIRLSGNVVEYLFATDQVSASVGHMQYGISPATTGKLQTIKFAQFVLDRPVAVDVSGVMVEGMNIDLLRDNNAIKAHSLLAKLPQELLPEASDLSPPILRGYEAVNLSKSQAA